MTWVVWRQHRLEGFVALGVLVLLGVFLLITGVDMANSAQQLGLTDCLAHTADRSTCGPLEEAFQNQYGYLSTFGLFLLVLPILLGALVGAPLVARELEQHTHLLVWTQSITRFRWLTVKLALVLGAGLLTSGVVMALLIWWWSPFDQFRGHFSPNTFDLVGPVWLAAAVLALALGIFAGTLTRRVVLAIFLTIALFLAIRLPVELFWRQNFAPPITVTWALGQDTPPVRVSDQDWTIGRGWIDAQGNQTNNLSCSTAQTLDQCLQANGLRANYLTYQPADRFWTFQWIEAGIYLAFAALALGATGWLVRRRLN